jgi:3-phenylpropionate/trans-cinnamate dioxygenase ferredoxin reductase component
VSGLSNVAVVGASLAGLRAVETLRRKGFAGRLTLVGAESHLPYDRPPLSKDVLRGETAAEVDALALRRAPANYEELDLDLRLGRRASALDVDARTLELDDGSTVHWDGLLIATGARVRTLPDTPALEGLFTLRTLDDALALRGALEASPRRVVVVGAGFIGSEVASSCRAGGLDVTVVEALAVPSERILGAEMGTVCASLHTEHGTDLRLGVGVAGFESSEGRVSGVRLVDGTVVPADVVVVGVGVRPETDWLEGSGLEIGDGVVCDAWCRAAPGIVVAGDVARWHNPLFDESMRVEHWTNAVEQSAAAVDTLLADAAHESAPEFAPVPYFWSDQYDTKIQFAGRASGFDSLAVVDGAPEDRKFVALYGRDGRLVGALAFGRPRLLMQYRRLIAERASWDRALAGV